MSPVDASQAAAYRRGNIKFQLDRPSDVRKLGQVEAAAGGEVSFEAAGLRRYLSKVDATTRSAIITEISGIGTAAATRVANHLNAWLTEIGTPANNDPWISAADS